MKDNSIIKEYNIDKKDILISQLLLVIMVLVHELGHWTIFTICHWNLRSANYTATIQFLPYGVATVYENLLPLFRPQIVFGGFIFTYPFVHLWNKINIFSKFVIVCIILYGLFEGILFLMGFPLAELII
jgi:hypothetical protein